MLIILAGVSINMLVGDNGIITQAQTAKEENGRAEIIEKIQLEIADKQAENLGTIYEDEFYEILGKYGTVSADETTLTTTEGNYEIAIADIYSGKLTSSLVTTPLESWEYTISGNNIILTKYIGTDAKIFIPNTFLVDGNNYQTKLKDTDSTNNIGPFFKNETIQVVRFGDAVEGESTSGYALFYNCINLVKVYNIPSNYTNLQAMFGLCQSLESAPVIPENVTSMIGTFSACIKLSGTIEILAQNITNVEACFTTTYGNIVLKVDKNSTTYQTFLTQIDLWTNVSFYGETVTNIACYGDSLTAGAGSTTMPYPKQLKTLGKRFVNVVNLGVGGENSKSIAIRQGAIPIYTDSFTIPADTSAVEIEIKDADSQSVFLAGQGDAGLNPCYINNVEGTISKSGDKYYFTRTSSGNSVTVTSGTQIITDGMKNHRDDLMIIWAGTNDRPSASTIQNVINNIDSMIEYSSNSNYIVIGLTSKSYMPEVEEVNEILAEKYGEHFLDIRKYLLENGLSDAGITATAQDEIDINSGEIPSSLRYDEVHFNDYGYTIVGTQVYNKLISLGYIEE